MVAAGALREIVLVQDEQRTPNGQGGFTTAWQTTVTVRAEIVGLSGDEALKAGIERNVQQWRVKIYRRDSVTPKSRLIWRGMTMNIKSAMPDPKDIRAATLLLCESGG